MINQGSSLSADPTSWIYSKGNTSNLAGIEVGVGLLGKLYLSLSENFSFLLLRYTFHDDQTSSYIQQLCLYYEHKMFS